MIISETIGENANGLHQVYHGPNPAAATRDWWQAVRRGFSQRCPHCGQGTLFYKYLKTRNECEACGEEFHHHRADDAPPYVTIMIVGHIVGALMLAGHQYDLNPGVWVEAILWPLLGLLSALWFLPRVKGALIAYQWALRMHGFAGEPDAARSPGAAPLAESSSKT